MLRSSRSARAGAMAAAALPFAADALPAPAVKPLSSTGAAVRSVRLARYATSSRAGILSTRVPLHASKQQPRQQLITAT